MEPSISSNGGNTINTVSDACKSGLNTAPADEMLQPAPVAMHRAVFTRNIDEISMLFDMQGMTYYDVMDTHYNTPLMLAVKLG